MLRHQIGANAIVHATPIWPFITLAAQTRRDGPTFKYATGEGRTNDRGGSDKAERSDGGVGGVQRSLSPEESADASRPSEPNSEGGKP